MNKLQYLQYLGKLGNQGGKKQSWTPARLSNLSLWLDAADASTITLNVSTVSQWNDKSGNSRNVTQATGAAQPTYLASGLHGRPSVQFAAGDFMGTATGFGAQTQRHVFTVNTYATALVDYQYVWSTANLTSTTGSGFIPRTPAAGDDWLADDIFALSNGFGVSQNPRYIATRTQSTAFNIYQVALGNTESTIRINGTANASPRVQTLANFPADTSAFQLSKSTQSLQGELSEIVYVDGNLSATDRQRIEGYLAWKWGLVANLPVGHPYKNTPPK